MCLISLHEIAQADTKHFSSRMLHPSPLLSDTEHRYADEIYEEKHAIVRASVCMRKG